MPQTLTIDAVAKAMVEELSRTCGARLGAEGTAAPTDVPNASGWLLVVPVSGSADGRIAVWMETASAAAYARVVAAAEQTPADDAIAKMLTDLVTESAAAVTARPDHGGLVFGAPEVKQGLAPQGSPATYVAGPKAASCLMADGVDRPASQPTSKDRLDAVLDVDLPLVVRFGRTVMPIHAVAELGPGSVIDMGRSPEEPVDLLIGDRLLARGEVVLVGGNYGVRVTQLVGGRDTAAADREARS